MKDEVFTRQNNPEKSIRSNKRKCDQNSSYGMNDGTNATVGFLKLGTQGKEARVLQQRDYTHSLGFLQTHATPRITVKVEKNRRKTLNSSHFLIVSRTKLVKAIIDKLILV